MKLLRETQDCPHCGEEVNPLSTGAPIPQHVATHTVYTARVTCPECYEHWSTQVVPI